MQIRAMLAAALLAATPAWAINKCTDDTGKVSYQDEKCRPGKSEELKIMGNTAQGETVGHGGVSTNQYTKGSPYENPPVYSSGSRAVHTGPRGGRYTIGPSGNRNYIPRSKR